MIKFPAERVCECERCYPIEGSKSAEKKGSQVRMFFSSGSAQMNGGGSVCIVTYSFESWKVAQIRQDGSFRTNDGTRTRLWAALLAVGGDIAGWTIGSREGNV